MRRLKKLILLVILCCCAPRSEASSVVDTTAQAPEALVLGLRAADGSLQTLFVDAQGIQVLGSGVAVPRRTGWWKLGLSPRTANKGQYKDVTLWAVPAGKKTALKGLGDVAGCENDTTHTVLFVGSDWVSSEISSGGYCEGAAHPYAVQLLQTRSIDALQNGKNTKIDAVLGPEAATRLKADGLSARGTGEEAECLEEPNLEHWALLRTRGHWQARGGLSHAYEVCRGSFKAYPLKMSVPEKVTGHDKIPGAWETWTASHSDLTDVLASPSGRVVVLVTKRGLTLQVDGKTVAEHPAPGSAAVLTQWAVGAKNVARWRKEAAAALKF